MRERLFRFLSGSPHEISELFHRGATAVPIFLSNKSFHTFLCPQRKVSKSLPAHWRETLSCDKNREILDSPNGYSQEAFHFLLLGVSLFFSES
jgi:hypothetical protein